MWDVVSSDSSISIVKNMNPGRYPGAREAWKWIWMQNYCQRMEWGAKNSEHRWTYVIYLLVLNPGIQHVWDISPIYSAREHGKVKTHLLWNSSGAFSMWKSCGKYCSFSLFYRVFTARGDNQAQTYYIQIIHVISFQQLLVSLLLNLFQTDKCIFLWLLWKSMSLFTALMPNLQPSTFPYKIKGKYIWCRKLQRN